MFVNRTAIAALVWMLAPQTTYADAPWVPIVVDHKGADDSLAVVRVVGTVLRTEHNVELLDPAHAAQLFEQRHSVEPVQVEDDELRILRSSVDNAVELVGHGEYETAKQALGQLYSLSAPAQDYVKRKLQISKDLFELCLMEAAATLKAGRRESAESEMRDCILGSLEQELPSSRSWSPEIGDLYNATRKTLFGEARAQLVVDVRQSADLSATDGCVASVNGAPQGAVRWKGQLLPGTVRVQVNCALQAGRVYVRKLDPSNTAKVLVDRRFDDAVHTADYLSLRYLDDRREQQAMVPDAVAIGKLLKTPDVLLVRTTQSGQVQLTRFDVALKRERAVVSLRHGASDGEILAAARALADGRSGDIVAAKTAGCNVQTAPAAREGQGGRLVAGFGAAALAAALYGTSWVKYGEALGTRRRFIASADRAALVRYEEQVVPMVAYSAFGAAAGSVAVVALLPDADGVPWWSWAIGGAGAATAGAGIFLWTAGQDCTATECSTRDGIVEFGPMLALHAAPMLAVPLTYALRSLFDTDTVTASASAGERSVSLVMNGSF